jgi:FAD dependent oxidoreductase
VDPSQTRYLVVGAGVHGLSTAWHLAKALRSSGRGDGRDVLVIDKTDVGAGASGIACGVIRNNYFQPAMRELMAHSVDVWESDQAAFSYHPVGYLQISPEAMHEGVAQIHEQQRAIGYRSTFVEGADDSSRYMRGIFSDWQAKGITSVLHEHRGGYANNRASVRGLAAKARAEGVRIQPGTRVTALTIDGGAVTAVETDRGTIRVEAVVIAVGPWVRDLWRMLELPERIRVRAPDGSVRPDREMWTYWSLQEGTLGVDPAFLTDNRGEMPPVVHVDTDAPLLDRDGSLVTDRMWGIYFKPDFNFGGVQGGAMPFVVDRPAVRAGQPRLRGRRGVRPDVDIGARALPQALRGQGGPVLQGAVGRHRLLHARQLSRLRPVPAERLRHRRLQPRLQDDRCRRPGGQGAAGRAAGAARAVPVRPLRAGPAAPHQQLAVPVELRTP